MDDSTISWADIRQYLTNDILVAFKESGDNSSSLSSITGKRLHFYGNDGVCLFKFFVSKGDPQEQFIWSVLGVNFACFFVITISYIFIHFFSAKSASGFSNSATTKLMRKRNAKLQRKISLIILTEFFCWIPLIFICIFHYAEVIDASGWYPYFSTLILPINSVINPLLYDTTVTDVFGKGLHRIRVCFGCDRLELPNMTVSSTIIKKKG
eukprot:sb/3470239/